MQRPLFIFLFVLAGCGKLVFGPPPTIHSFSADAAVAGWGEPVALRWSVSGASGLTLSRTGHVGSRGAVVRPTESRILTDGAAASLRADGIAAFVSGAGQGGAAQLTIRSGANAKPHVVVVRLSGTLPRD